VIRSEAANRFLPIAKCVIGAPNAGRDVFRLGFPVNDEIRRAWEIVSNTRGGARRSLWRPLAEDNYEHKLEGTVIARGSFAPRRGPVTTEIKCADGAVWVIDYDEQSPYQAFIGRRVVASGFPCHPPMQHRIGVAGHFAVSRMRVAGLAPDAWLIDVGPPQEFAGRFKHSANEAAETELSFLTENGDTFRVVNNPAGMAVNEVVNVLAYPIQLSPCVSRRLRVSLWVVCPWSYAQLEKLRGGPNGGLPNDVYIDAVSGQIRCRTGTHV
jgi:hypothetical protein